jgi:hypothetical protein
MHGKCKGEQNPMINTTSTTSSEAVNLEFALPNAGSAADAILASAIGFSTQKMQVSGSGAVMELLKRGDRTAMDYFHYGLAEQVAEFLGGLDDEVQAVYLYDDEATSEDAAFGEVAPSLIHLIVLARRKTGALDSLIVALCRAVVQSYGRLLDKPQLRHILDVQVVDNAELEAHVGLGALMSSLHHRPSRVWQR